MGTILQAGTGKSYASLRSYIYYSTLLGLMFGAIFYVHIPFLISVFDVIMLTNFLLMFLLVNYARVPAWIPCLILYLALSGVIGIVNGTDTLILFAKEFLGISLSLLYFYYFFRVIGNDFERAFGTYLKIAVWFAILGVPFWIQQCFQYHSFLRMHGLASEPASLCVIILPAYYWYAYLYLKFRKHIFEVIVFTATVILAGSSLGYLSVAFGIALLFSGRVKHLLAVPILVGGVLYFAYSTSFGFQSRVNDTVAATATADLTDSNLSTYALMSNAFVTQEVLRESPIIGNGLGSHLISHDRFIANVPGVVRFLMHGWEDINAPDAASLTLRTLSELGVVGFLGLLIFLFYFHVGGSGIRGAISNALLVAFFLKLVRQGLYFPPEQFFFIFIYMLNHRKFKLENRTGVGFSSWERTHAGLDLLAN